MKNKVNSVLVLGVAATLAVVTLNRTNIKIIDSRVEESFKAISEERGLYARELDAHGLRDLSHLVKVIKAEVKEELRETQKELFLEWIEEQTF